jgi:hypothetical protein
VPQAFEDMFAAIDKDGDGYLSLGDLWALIGRNKMVADFFGVCFLPNFGTAKQGRSTDIPIVDCTGLRVGDRMASVSAGRSGVQGGFAPLLRCMQCLLLPCLIMSSPGY